MLCGKVTIAAVCVAHLMVQVFKVTRVVFYLFLSWFNYIFCYLGDGIPH